MEYPELKRTVLAHAREWTPRNILIEDRASGTQLIQELRQEGLSTLTRCDSKEEKIVRMSTASNMIENGRSTCRRKRRGSHSTSTSWSRSQMGNITTRPIPPRKR